MIKIGVVIIFILVIVYNTNEALIEPNIDRLNK
jgi:hypothetical protein